MNTDFQNESEEFDPQTYAIIGAAMAVHREKGCGFLESVYQESLAIELEIRGISYAREQEFPLEYRGHPLKCKYIADFVCFSDVIVELKAVDKLSETHFAQLLNYLKCSGFKRGIILNFGSKSLTFRRVVL